MAIKEHIEYIAQELPKAHPTEIFQVFNSSNAGIGFALKSLYSAEGNCLSAGEISDAMGVSTARVAVLLKKMENKGLIIKKRDKTDARVTIVCLSEEGKATAKQMREKIFRHIADVIDKIGIEKLKQFIELSIEVKTAMEKDFPPKPDTL